MEFKRKCTGSKSKAKGGRKDNYSGVISKSRQFIRNKIYENRNGQNNGPKNKAETNSITGQLKDKTIKKDRTPRYLR